MKLIADSGLWSTGPLVEPVPIVAVLEVSGAVLSWTVDDPTRAVDIAFTDLTRADWLWRLLGESGHAAVAAALEGRLPGQPQTVELAGVDVLAESVEPLRRLALGHWLRRWWPESHRDGIAGLDAALLDAEIAVLTHAAQDYFSDDTLDSDVTDLIRPHSAALIGHTQDGDPRVIELVRACTELADDIGIDFAQPAQVPARRDDYALAAGSDADARHAGAIAAGMDSVSWGGVPPAVFDAAENTVDWQVESVAGLANAVVRVELSRAGSPDGIDVRLQAGTVSGAGVLRADGLATFPLVDAQERPIAETAAWNHDWRTAAVSVGAEVEESPQTRDRVRDVARTRLAEPGSDAFLVEILAAESDY